jgi:hypothetical protein
MTVKEGREEDFVRVCNVADQKASACTKTPVYYEFFKLREPRRYAVLESFRERRRAEHAHMTYAMACRPVPDDRRLRRRDLGARIPGQVRGLNRHSYALTSKDTRMTCFIATLKIKPGHEGRFRTPADGTLATDARDRAGHGRLRHHPLARLNPNTYIVYARFKDAGCVRPAPGTPISTIRLVPPIMETLDGEMDLKFYDFIA